MEEEPDDEGEGTEEDDDDDNNEASPRAADPSSAVSFFSGLVTDDSPVATAPPLELDLAIFCTIFIACSLLQLSRVVHAMVQVVVWYWRQWRTDY